jgi:hypothetical protein
MPGRENLGKIIAILEYKLCSIYGVEFSITKGFSGIHNMDIIMSAINKIANNLFFIFVIFIYYYKYSSMILKDIYEKKI